MSLALQARKLGLHAHGMAGFEIEKAYKATGASAEEYDIIALVAVGRRNDPDALPEDFRKMEAPNDRKSLSEVSREGRAMP